MARDIDWLERMRGEAVPRRDLDSHLARAAMGGVGLLAALAVWELLSQTNALPQDSFPPATDIVARFFESLTMEATWVAIRETMTGWALGLLIAVPAAVAVGALIGSSNVLFSMFRPIIEFLRPVPSVALIPLGVLLFGVEMDVKVFLVVYAVFWPMLYQAVYGVRSADRIALESGTVYGLGRVGRGVRIVLPSATPYLMTGLRLASSIALVLCVTAELVIGIAGLGDVIASKQSIGEYTDMYAFILLTGVIGIALNTTFRVIERRLVWWLPDRRVVAVT